MLPRPDSEVAIPGSPTRFPAARRTVRSVQVFNDESRPAPIIARGFDISFEDVLAQGRCLVVFKTNKNAAMSRAVFGVSVDLIEE
jgi:hypothetical protein